MAAHDENISQNRRRLFKALSAAPVVATLRPGAALAGSSSYQCLIDPPTPSRSIYLEPLPATCGPEEGGCVAYVERPYWEAPPRGTDPVVNACRDAWDAVVSRGEIVIYDPATSTLGTLDRLGLSYTPLTPTPTGWSVDTNMTPPVLSYPRTPTDFCELPAETGYFLLKVEPNGDYTDFAPIGVYPEETGGDASWKSCWNSFDKDTTGVTFVKG